MALDPEAIKRRQRREQRRAPHRPLRAKLEGLSADEKLEVLLKEILEEAKTDTLFTMTLERDRLFSALLYAGFVAPIWVNTEIQLAPLAATSVYVAIPPGFVVVPGRVTSVTSLPWWLTSSIWIDTEPPALPSLFFLRGPETYEFVFSGIVPVRRYLRIDVFNNHVANTANLISMMEAGFLTEASWKMLEAIYLKPIAEYAQEKAEELTGRPFP
ncbi:hypothetical protein ES703_112545 [subsurface metagenome]